MRPGSGLRRNTGFMLVNQVGRMTLQAAYFVLLARSLGVAEYGAFSAVLALVMLVGPFASLGAINLMIRNIARDPSAAAQEYADACRVTVIAGTAMTAVLLVLGLAVAPRGTSLLVVLFLCLSEFFGTRLIEVAGAVYQAQERMFWTAAFPLVLYGARLLSGLILLICTRDASATGWAFAVMVGSLTSAAVITTGVRRTLGHRQADLTGYRRDWKEGVLFSVSLAAQTVYNDIDKVMLGRLGTLAATGVYTAAYRVVDMAFTPMRALMGAAYPRFFRAGGAEGLRGCVRLARRLAVPGVAYNLAVCPVLLVGASLLPTILGSSFADSVGTLRALAALPLLKACHYLAADSLTGAGRQLARSRIQIVVAVGNVALNLWLIPAFGVRGAVVASLLSDGLLAVLLWTLIGWTLRRDHAKPVPAVHPAQVVRTAG